MPGSNQRPTDRRPQQSTFRLRPDQLEVGHGRISHRQPRSSRGPPSCRHFPAEDEVAVRASDVDNTRLDRENRVLQRQLDQQRRRVEDMSDVLRYSREERQRLEQQMREADAALDESQSMLQGNNAMKDMLAKELDSCRRDLHAVCLGVIEVGCLVPSGGGGMGKPGDSTQVILDRAREELLRLNEALHKRPLSHPASVVGKILGGALKRSVRSAMSEWSGMVGRYRETLALTTKSFLRWRLWTASRREAKHRLAAKHAFAAWHRRNAFDRWRLWRRHVAEILSLWTAGRLLAMQRRCVISWRATVAARRKRREEERIRVLKALISWRAVTAVRDDARSYYEGVIANTLARRERAEILRFSFLSWRWIGRSQQRELTARRSTEVARYLAVQSAFVQWRRCLVIAADRRLGVVQGCVILRNILVGRIGQAVAGLREVVARQSTAERLEKVVGVVASHRPPPSFGLGSCEIILRIWRSEASRIGDQIRHSDELARRGLREAARRALILWRFVSRSRRSSRMLEKLASLPLCRTQKNLKTSIFGHWRRQYQMVCEERELLVVNLKKKCLLLWYFATKSAVEQSEMMKPLDAALMEKVIISWRARVHRTRGARNGAIVLGRIIEKLMRKIYFSQGIEALSRHACIMNQRMTLRRIRHEVAAGSDRQVLSEALNIWSRVGARRRGAEAFQNLRKGKILGGIIRMWREEVRVSRRERTVKDTLSSMAETRLKDTLSRILWQWSSWARSGKILRRMIIARTEELNRELLTMAFDGWKDILLKCNTRRQCFHQELGQSRTRKILRHWLRVVGLERYDRLYSAMCSQRIRRTKAERLRSIFSTWRASSAAVKRLVTTITRMMRSRCRLAVMKWKLRTCTERIMVRIAEGLTPKRCSVEIVFNEWRKWCERRSAASIRRSAVSSMCAHREELAGRQILREWRSLCVRLVLLRRLVEVGGYRHRSAYLRRAFNVLKWGGLRTWRRGLAHLEGAMRSALQRRGHKILSMLLRHSARENIEQRNLGCLESFRRLCLRNTVRLALLRWRKEVVDTRERLRKLEMIFVELTVGGRRCFSAWRDYSRERRRKTRVLDQISRQVDVKARKELLASTYRCLISWRATSHRASYLRGHSQLCAASSRRKATHRALRRWVVAAREVRLHQMAVEKEREDRSRRCLANWYGLSRRNCSIRQQAEQTVQSRQCAFFYLWRYSIRASVEEKLARTLAAISLLQPMVHGQLKAGMSSFRGCHQRNVYSRMRLLMLSRLSFLSRRAIKREFFRQWCWSTLGERNRSLSAAQSEDTLVVWRVLLMWRMLAWRRILGCRGLERALVKCRRRRLMIAVYALVSWRRVSLDREHRLARWLNARRRKRLLDSLARWSRVKPPVRPSRALLNRLLSVEDVSLSRQVFETWKSRRHILSRLNHLLTIKESAAAFAHWRRTVLVYHIQEEASAKLALTLRHIFALRLSLSVIHWRSVVGPSYKLNRLYTALESSTVLTSSKHSRATLFGLWKILARRSRVRSAASKTLRRASDAKLRAICFVNWQRAKLRRVKNVLEARSEELSLLLIMTLRWWCHLATLQGGRWQKPSCGDWLRHIGPRLALSRHIPEPFRRCFQGQQCILLNCMRILQTRHSQLVKAKCLKIRVLYGWREIVSKHRTELKFRVLRKLLHRLSIERYRLILLGSCLHNWQKFSLISRTAKQEELLCSAASELRLLRGEVREAADRARHLIDEDCQQPVLHV